MRRKLLRTDFCLAACNQARRAVIASASQCCSLLESRSM